MPAATFLGTTALTYTQYLDTDLAGTTLVAEPRGTYDITIADDWQVGDVPGDGLWGTSSPALGAGFNAIPGRAFTGISSPGYPGDSGEPEDAAVLGERLGDALAVPASVSATFLGTSPRTYTQYLDTDPAGAGTTLVAEPLNTYQIAIADNWQGLSGVPADGLWGAVPRGVLSFTITPGFAVPGGMTTGFPGFASAPEAMEDVFAPEAAVVVPAMPLTRVVRGHGRRLRPAPARRRPGRRELAGVRRVRH